MTDTAVTTHTTRGMRQVEERLGQPLKLYLLDAYVVRELSLVAIGRELDVDKGTVSRWMAQLGISRRYVGYNGRGRAA